MFTVGSLLHLPGYKCFHKLTHLTLTTTYQGKLPSDHDTDDELGSEGLRNLLKVTQPASGRAGFEPRTLNHFNAALYRG